MLLLPRTLRPGVSKTDNHKGLIVSMALLHSRRRAARAELGCFRCFARVRCRFRRKCSASRQGASCSQKLLLAASWFETVVFAQPALKDGTVWLSFKTACVVFVFAARAQGASSLSRFAESEASQRWTRLVGFSSHLERARDRSVFSASSNPDSTFWPAPLRENGADGEA